MNPARSLLPLRGAQTIHGATPSSAATSPGATGRNEFASHGEMFVPGEGWVSWGEIHRSVAVAFARFCERRRRRNTARRLFFGSQQLTPPASLVGAAETKPTHRGLDSASKHKSSLAAPLLAA